MKKFFVLVIIFCLVFTSFGLIKFFETEIETAIAAIELEATSAAVYSDPYSTDGKRIVNEDLLRNMTIFPNHDKNNGCGMVAMSVLLQFYNDLDTLYQEMYIPNDNWNYAADYLNIDDP